jgi:hypothetical protein
VYCDTPSSVANRGTWCRQTSGSCSDAETDSDCAEDIGQLCEKGRIEPFYMERL